MGTKHTEPIMPRRIFLAVVAIVCAALPAAADKGKSGNPNELNETNRIAIIRTFNGELAFARKAFPMGEKGLVIFQDGKIAPEGKDLDMQLATHGVAANVGDRARITDVIFKHDAIIFEINGGPKHKKKWYQRIEVGGGSGTTPISKQPDEFAKGSYVALKFDKFIPNLSTDQVKERLANVLDFKATNSFDAYIETIPPKAKQAIKNHQVLVGMNRQMVMYSVGKPGKKVREKDGDTEYEEWIYGEPPQEVKFVRFVGDEVARLEVMTVDGQKIVKTEKEIDLKTEQPQQAQVEPHPANAPTLRRPGEQPEGNGEVAPAPGTKQPGGMSRPVDLPPPPGTPPQQGDPGSSPR